MPLQAPGPATADSPTIPAAEMEDRFVYSDGASLLAEGPFDFIVVGAGAGGYGKNHGTSPAYVRGCSWQFDVYRPDSAHFPSHDAVLHSYSYKKRCALVARLFDEALVSRSSRSVLQQQQLQQQQLQQQPSRSHYPCDICPDGRLLRSLFTIHYFFTPH